MEHTFDYTRPRDFTARLHGQDVHYTSKPGLPDWDRVRPSIALLAQDAEVQNNENALLLGCGPGALATIISRLQPRSQIVIMDANFIGLEMTEKTLASNRIDNAVIHYGISLPSTHLGGFDVVIIDLPKGRKVAQRWLLEAWRALKTGGRLYLAGANSTGIQSAARDAEALFEHSTILSYRKGNRLIRLAKPIQKPFDGGWMIEPGIVPETWCSLLADTHFGEFELKSLPGIFSFDRLDDGTRMLLEHLEISHSDRVLDLGCGYGIIGLATARAGAERVDLVDVNLLAVAAAGENLTLHSIKNAQVLPSDVLSAVSSQRYTLIASNPPFHSGKSVDYHIAEAFIQQSRGALESGGRLLLVANRFIRYDRLIKRIFAQLHIIAEDRKYQVMLATK